MDKQMFLEKVRAQIGTNFGATAEECTRAVFETLHERLDEGQAGHIETHLPKDLKDAWKLDVGGRVERMIGDEVRRLDRTQFLNAVQNRARLGSLQDAERATAAVFSVLREILPEKDVRDTASELPGDLRALWLGTAAGMGPQYGVPGQEVPPSPTD